MNLIPYLESIKDLKPLEQTLKFNPDHWSQYNYNNVLVTNDMEFIAQNYPKGISRQDIISYFSKEGSTLIRGFLLTMVWGHGFSEHGKADNRGPWKVSQMISNLDNTIIILENAKEYLKNDNIQLAHSSFRKMDRCRVSFFSKYLYFLGRSLKMTHYPLIFDARVAKTIVQLISKNPEMYTFINTNHQPRQDRVSYNNYVMEIHRIANELNVESEKIEYFLFNRNLAANN
jgi:hypothetical protein